MSKSANIDALVNATGRSWDDWVRRFESTEADKLTHKEIAEFAFTLMPEGLQNPGWWAQAAAVAYEQHIGRRLPGQAQDGTFQGSASATITANLDQALERWLHTVEPLTSFNSHTLSAPPTVSSSERWRYWRAGFSDGTKTQVDISLKGEKANISVNITKASSPDAVSEWKSFWRQILAQVKG